MRGHYSGSTADKNIRYCYEVFCLYRMHRIYPRRVDDQFYSAAYTCASGMQGSANGLAALFFSMAYMQFLGLAECADTMMRLPVFYKQKYNLLFPGWTYAVPFATIHIPRAVLEMTMWTLVVYWGVGFGAHAARCVSFHIPYSFDVLGFRLNVWVNQVHISVAKT